MTDPTPTEALIAELGDRAGTQRLFDGSHSEDAEAMDNAATEIRRLSTALTTAQAERDEERRRTNAMHQRAQQAESKVARWEAKRNDVASPERVVLWLEEHGAASIAELAAQRDEARAALTKAEERAWQAEGAAIVWSNIVIEASAERANYGAPGIADLDVNRAVGAILDSAPDGYLDATIRYAEEHDSAVAKARTDA